MAVRVRGTGFQADFMVAGQRFREHFDTVSDAERWEFETRQALKLGKPLPVGRPKQVGGGDKGTLGNVLRSAKKNHWGLLRARTGGNNANMFVKWAGHNADPMTALSMSSITKFVEHLIDVRKVSNSTINYYLSEIGVLVKTAGFPRLDMPWKKQGKGRKRFYSEKEEGLILQTLTLWGMHREKDFFIFLVDTGARPYSEGTKLSWENVRDRKVTFEFTKNDVTRTLPLTKRANEAVERQRVHDEAGPFTGIGQKRMTAVYDRLRLHIESLADTVLYTARHTCASRQVAAGIDLMRVMRWMGHTNYNTTLGYAHLAPDVLLDNLNALEGGTTPRLKVVR